MNEPMTREEVLACLKEEHQRAKDHYEQYLEPLTNVIKAFYDADEFGDETEGLSRIVLPDVQETVDYMAISVLRAFVSGDRVVEFEAQRQEDELAADEATEVIGYMFSREQDGYRVLHDWLKTALLKYGVVKAAAYEEREIIRERIAIGPDDILPEGVDVDAVEETQDGTVIHIKREFVKRRYEDMVLPWGEYLFSPRARHEDSADYQCHRVRKTRSDLVEMGFNAEQVDTLSVEDGEWYKRDIWDDAARDKSMQEVTLLEEYIRLDVDGDGVAERYRVFRVGDEILEIEGNGDQPFVVCSAYPEAGKLVGQGLAEKTMDLQRLRSFIARQLVDGMTLANRPRLWVPQESVTEDTFDDLLNIVPGAPVRGRGMPPQSLQYGVDVGRSLTVLEWATGERESRTGITRLNQGLDADALNKTASGTAMMQAAGQQHEEFIARNFAECLSRLFRKKLKLIKESGQPLSVKVRGQYVQVDPSTWPDDMNVIIRVGLGTGRKDSRLAAANQLLSIQREAMAIGMATPANLYRTAEILVKDSGLGQPDDYFTPPDQVQPQEPSKDPKAIEAEAKAAHDMAKLQGEQQLAQQRMDIARWEAQEKQKLAREQREFEAQLARERQQDEIALALEKMSAEASLAASKMSDPDLPAYRPGGDLSA